MVLRHIFSQAMAFLEIIQSELNMLFFFWKRGLPVCSWDIHLAIMFRLRHQRLRIYPSKNINYIDCKLMLDMSLKMLDVKQPSKEASTADSPDHLYRGRLHNIIL